MEEVQEIPLTLCRVDEGVVSPVHLQVSEETRLPLGVILRIFEFDVIHK